MYQGLTPLTNIQSLRDQYSFFLTISQASKPGGILAWLQFGLRRQSAELIMYKKNCVQLEHF